MNTIFIHITDTSEARDLERYRDTIHSLFITGVMTMRNGQAVLDFDNDGVLQDVELRIKRKRKSLPVIANPRIYLEARVETALQEKKISV